MTMLAHAGIGARLANEDWRSGPPLHRPQVDLPGLSLLASAVDRQGLLSAAEAVFGTSSVAVALCTDADVADRARVLWVNAAFERLSGYAAARVIGRPATVLAGAHVDPIHMSEIELLREHPDAAPFGVVTTKQRPDGSWYDVEERLISVRNHRSGSLHVLLVQTRLTAARAETSRH
jgi:PAS domain S-box-containing protein